MEHAGRFAHDQEEAAMLREVNGIGTADTRAKILEILLEREYVGSKGKSLLSTEKGRDLVRYAPSAMTSVQMTAEWESIMADVENADDREACRLRDKFLSDARANSEALLKQLAEGVEPRASGTPSEKALAYAQRIATDAGIALPDEAAVNAKACSDFIDAHVSTRQSAPSPKALEYALQLAEQTGAKLPEEAAVDYRVCKEFIDKAKKKRPPSPKMLKAAEWVARKTGKTVPKGAATSFEKCKAFLDRNSSAS